MQQQRCLNCLHKVACSCGLLESCYTPQVGTWCVPCTTRKLRYGRIQNKTWNQLGSRLTWLLARSTGTQQHNDNVIKEVIRVS